MRRRYDIPITRCGDVRLKRLGDVPSRRRWVFHLGHTCDVAGTYREREKSLLRRHDVLMSGGWLVRQLRQFFKDANCLLLSFFFLENYRFCQKYGNVTNSRGWGESCCNTTWKLIHDSPLSCIKLRVAICILVCIMWVIRKIDCFIRKCSILVKIRGSMFCVTNRCRKVIAN